MPPGFIRASRVRNRPETVAAETEATTSYRLRIELPNQPGALARVAGALGSLGANVISVDIHEIAGDVAVDEIVIDAPQEWDLSSLGRVLDEAGCGALVSLDPSSLSSDPIVRALRWASAMVDAGPQYSDLELSRAVAEACTGIATWVCDRPAAMMLPIGRAALERGVSLVERSESLPGPRDNMPSEVWLLAVPDRSVDPALVIFVARPLSLRFTDSEIARVEALLRLCRQLGAPAETAALHEAVTQPRARP